MYTVSVQILNCVMHVQDLVQGRDLPGCLSQSFLETMSISKVLEESDEDDNGCGGNGFIIPLDNPILDPMHIVLL